MKEPPEKMAIIVLSEMFINVKFDAFLIPTQSPRESPIKNEIKEIKKYFLFEKTNSKSVSLT